ncbi:MAG: hypothetical protein HY905_16805 [Deltaproteobacteria bacterium]|nr:hypothetical protein [Deltaproteobacteria bacterium]
MPRTSPIHVALALAVAAAVASCHSPSPSTPSPEPEASPQGTDPSSSPACATPPDVLLSAQPCLLPSSHARVDRLAVAFPTLEPFFLDVRDVDVIIAPGLSPECTAVHVLGSLDFLATSSAVSFRPTIDGWPAGGPVTLTTQSHLTNPVAAPDGLLVDATVGAGVTIRHVPVPCSDLVVDDPFPFVSTWPTTTPNTPAWLPLSLPLSLAVAPGEPGILTLIADDPSLLPFLVTDRRDDLVRVSLSWSDGASVSGWVASSALVESTAPGYGDGPSGGEPTCREPGFGCSGPGLYCGSAEISPDAPVYAEPEKGRWATVVNGAGAFVMRNENTGWAQVRRLPGISDADACDLSHAWVPSSDVHPAEVASPAVPNVPPAESTSL